MNLLETSCYNTTCTVIKSLKDPDLFYMNMRVYEVVPGVALVPAQEEQVSNIWCAVYHVNKANVAGGSAPDREHI